MAIPLKRKVFVIGSSPKSQIRSRKDGVGHQHCALVSRKRKLYLQDLRSGCPTLVNGTTVTPGGRLVLKKGDRVAVGPMEFVVEQRRRRKKASVLVAAPFAAPPVPLGKPVGQRSAGPAAVPVTDALVSPFIPPHRPYRPGQEGRGWTMAAVAALAIVGLGLGLLISRAFTNGSGEDQTAERDEHHDKKEDNRLARREDKLGQQQAQNGQDRKTGERSVTPPRDPKDVKQPDQSPSKPAVDEQNKEKAPVKPEAGTGGKKSDKETKPEVEKKPEPMREVKKPDPMPEVKPSDPTKDNPVKSTVAYASHVQPILETRCLNCHGAAKKKGGLDLSSIAAMLRGGDTGPAIVAGDPEKSPLWMRVDDGSMPPAGKTLTTAEKKTLQDWILAAKNGTFPK
jgi:hypothetical protein